MLKFTTHHPGPIKTEYKLGSRCLPVYIISDHYLGSMFDLKEGVVGDKRLAEVAPALCHQSLEGALSGLSRAEVWPVTSHQFHSHLLLVHV